MRNKAFTLVEVVLVVALLGVLGIAMASGTGTASDEESLDLAGDAVVSALRYARSEALRTGVHHGARIESASARLRVYHLDTTSPTPAELFTVHHPVEKRLYDVRLARPPFVGLGIPGSTFLFLGSVAPIESVAFDPLGEPVSPVDLARLTSGAVTLASARGVERVVQLAPGTGRVTLQ